MSATVIPSIPEIAHAIGDALAVEGDVDTFDFLMAFTPTRLEQVPGGATCVYGRGLVPTVRTYRRADKIVSDSLGRKMYFNCTGEPFFPACLQ